MPSTQEKKISSERGFSAYGAGGEPPGEPPASRLGWITRGLSGGQTGEALEQARLRGAIEKLSEQARRELGYGPAVAIDEGIRLAASWYQAKHQPVRPSKRVSAPLGQTA